MIGSAKLLIIHRSANNNSRGGSHVHPHPTLDIDFVSFTPPCHLGASFFFKRGEGDRGNASKFFTTIAVQLAQNLPDLRAHLKKALDREPTISTKPMKEQFKQLILDPISESSSPLTTLIVIDGLDECEDEDHIKRIIHVLGTAQDIKSINLRLLLTSRPDLPPRLGFIEIPESHRTLHDIGAYLKDELPKIRDAYNRLPPSGANMPSSWPTERNVQDLIRMAVPLFIFAATMCRFIGDTWDPDPEGKLIKVLCYQSAGSLTQLKKTYLPVLNQILKGCVTETDREHRMKEFKDVIGTIVLLFEPLSRISLANLLGVSINIINRRLHILHSVLRVPTDPTSPVRLFHLSFRDFLVDSEHKTQF